MDIDPGPEALGPGAAVDLPFLVIGGLLRKKRCFRNQGEQVLIAEGYVAEFGLGAAIGVRWREQGVDSHAKRNQRGIHESLEAEIAVHVFGKISIGRNIPWLGFEALRAPRVSAPLTGNPVVKRAEEVLITAWKAKTLFDGLK